MDGDLFMVLLGAWLHQLLRVGNLLFRLPKALHSATQGDRLVVVGLRRAWSGQLNDDDRVEFEKLRGSFIWEFYVFLMIPMWLCIGWLLLR